MRNRRITIAIAGLSVAAIAGGIAIAATAGGSTALPSTATSSTTLRPSPTAATASPSASAPTTVATVRTAMASVGGSTEIILVDNKGLPLYFYKPDTATQSMVTGSLAALWPPLVAGSANCQWSQWHPQSGVHIQRPPGGVQRTLPLHLR